MAIIGLGTDVVEISRITSQLDKSQRLAERVLTPTELLTFSEHQFPERFLAKRFAAPLTLSVFNQRSSNSAAMQFLQFLIHQNNAHIKSDKLQPL